MVIYNLSKKNYKGQNISYVYVSMIYSCKPKWIECRRIWSFFWKQPAGIDFIGLIAYGTMQTDSKKTRGELCRVVKALREIAEANKRKPSWIPWLGLDFQGW